MGRVVAIVQARLGSSRLPGKVLMEAAGQPLLGHMLDRLQRVRGFDHLVVATPDQAIVDYCKRRGVDTHLGSEGDVLGRYVAAARANGADVVVRLTADCPLIDPGIVDQVITAFHSQGVDYLSNTLERGYPRGMDVEVMRISALEKAHAEATLPDEREHVTLHLYRHPERFSLGSFDLRLTVDTPEDFALVKGLLEALQSSGQRGKLSELLTLVEE